MCFIYLQLHANVATIKHELMIHLWVDSTFIWKEWFSLVSFRECSNTIWIKNTFNYTFPIISFYLSKYYTHCFVSQCKEGYLCKTSFGCSDVICMKSNSRPVSPLIFNQSAEVKYSLDNFKVERWLLPVCSRLLPNKLHLCWSPLWNYMRKH